MAKFAAKDSNKNITLSPHGTGKVVVGTGATDATVQSDGNHNLVLQTGNSTTGSITITDGADGNIDLTPNGTGEVNISKVDINGGAIDAVTLGTNSAITEAQIDDISLNSFVISSLNNENLKLKNTADTANIEIQHGGNIVLTPSGGGTVQADDLALTGAITGTVDVSGATFTTSTAQKQAISATAFASGTKMLFNQTSAPTGWTKDTSSNNNSALRVVTGTVGTGGSQDFTAAFGATISVATAVDNHTLAKTELPAHYHTIATIDQAGSPYNHSMAGGSASGSFTSDGRTRNGGDFSAGGHNHNTTMSGTGSSASTHNLSVKYVDVIIATKD